MNTVVHILRAFGDQLQPYTTQLLEQINSVKKMKHVVVCDLQVEKS